MRLLCLFILALTIPLAATLPYKDTIHIKSDTSGPLSVPNYFIEEIHLTTSNNVPLPAWRYYKATNQIRFEHTIPQNTQLILHYKTSMGKLKKEYHRYTPGDSTELQKIKNRVQTSTKQSKDQSIIFSGEKGITFSSGSSGGTSIEQTLDVSLTGKISEEISISGHISDQSTSLQGDSKEVGELDRVYLNVTGKDWDATVGDILKRERNTSLLETGISPKGGRFSLKKGTSYSEIYGGISGSKQASQTFTGISGIQSGIYMLTGEGTEGAVFIVNNTVQVTVDGKKLSEGEESGEFYVDYENSAIVFTNKFPIENGQLIEVKYHYKNSEYEKYTLGGSYEHHLFDSTLHISGEISVTGDNFESNERDYSAEDLAIIKQAGDQSPYITSGKKVHPNDILKEASRYRLYQKDTLLNRYYWEDAPESVGETYPLYIVQFQREESNEGEYLPYSTETKELFEEYSDSLLNRLDSLSTNEFMDPIYLYVGETKGTHTPKQKAILPERTTLGEISINFNPTERISIYSGVIGKHHDKNTQSDLEDSDNSSGYIESRIKLSTDVNKMLVTSSTSEFTYAPGTISERKRVGYNLNRTWGLESDTLQYTYWSEELSTNFKKKLIHRVKAGQLYVDNSLFSDLIESDLSYRGKQFSQNYAILFRNEETKSRKGHRQSYSNSLTLKPFEYTLLFEEEWFKENLLSKGYVKGEFSLLFPKLQWKHELKRRHDRQGIGQNIDAQDTAVTSLWKQSLSKMLNKNHRLELNSTIQKVEGDDNKSLLLLYGIRDNYTHPSRDLSSKLYISTTMESALTRIWEYLPVPKGTGTHIKDTLTGTYIESNFGDYIAKEVVLFGDSNKKTVRNTLQWNWNVKSVTRNKKSDGLRFSGNLSLSEDIEPEKSGISEAWLPSFTTFSETTKDSLIYSLISYRQNVSWLPTHIEKLFVQSEVEISQKISLGTTIKYLKGKNSLSKEISRLLLRFDTPWFIEKRAIYTYETTLREFLLEPLQELTLNKHLSTALTESIAHVSIDESQGTYVALTPSFSVTTAQNRKSTLSYTAGYVSLNRDPVYPLAKDFRRGLNHRFALNLNIKAGKLTTISGFLRADYHKDTEWATSLSLNALVKIN